MEAAKQSACEIDKVIILHRSGSEVLVVPDAGRLSLPVVRTPRGQRVAETVTTAVHNDWQQEVVYLFELDTPPDSSDGSNRYHVSELWKVCGGATRATKWAKVSDLSTQYFVDSADYNAICRSLTKCDSQASGTPANPFTQLGWFGELREWIKTAIEPLGLRLAEDFRQLNASSTFSLIRFETNGPAVWFKAVGEPNQREFPITRTLARLFPTYLPTPVAARLDCNGWLARDVSGNVLAETQETALWEKAAAELAALQIKSIGYHEEILSAGACDLSVSSLSKAVRPFLGTMECLMKRQANTSPPTLDHNDLLTLGDHILNALDAAEAVAIPDALGHLDLNPGNIIISPDHCAFLDWAEACFGHPFLTFEYLCEHLHRALGRESAIEATLIEAYCRGWEQIISPGAIAEALISSPLLAVFAYAAGNDRWKDEALLQEPVTAGYFRSLTRRMFRESQELMRRRLLCLD
jgi:Phosphotransferase enzyme family